LQTGATPVARVVVERLDSLGAGVFGDNVVCGAADEDTGFTILSHSPAQPASPHSDLFGPPSPDCAQLTAEKEESLDSFELYVSPATRVNPGLRLDTTLDTELDTLLETPTTEAMLDNILAETDYIDNKWTQQLDDLFPELD